MIARTFALAGIVALLLLQIVWHAVIAPPATGTPWALVLFFCLPMLPCLWLLVRGHRAALLVGAIAALLYFCHGVMIAMAVSSQRGPAIAEIALSVLVVVASSWNGMRMRFARKPAV